MSNLVINISDLRSHYKENHLVKVRIIGTILDFNPLGRFILIQPTSLLSEDRTTVKLILQEDIRISSDPQLAYPGTLVDSQGLYNGETVALLSLRVITDPNLLYENKDVFNQISSLKLDPL
jgi:hypothetical protein